MTKKKPRQGIDGGSGTIDPGPPTPPATDPTTQPLIQAGDVTLVGCFRVPPWVPGAPAPQSPGYGGHGLCYWPNRGSLLLVGNNQHQWVTEITVPAAPSLSSNLADLPFAETIQPYTDVFCGKRLSVDGDTYNGVEIGGFTPDSGGDALLAVVWTYYDNAHPPQKKVLFRIAKTDFSQLTPDDVQGPFQIGTGFSVSIPQGSQDDHDHRIGGFASGYLTKIPPDWQELFGGMMRLCGQGGGVSILNRTSSGPSAQAFRLPSGNERDPIQATMLMGYPSDSSNPSSPFHHPTLGTWGEDGSGAGLYNGMQNFRGMVWPDGTRSILFVGWGGTTFCYGAPTSDPALHGQPVPNQPGQIYCYDPVGEGTGPHGYPSRGLIFGYDANHFLDAQAGRTKPWDVVPYATWHLPPLPFQAHVVDGVDVGNYDLWGAAWDQERRWLFASAYHCDGDNPLILVYHVK